MTRPTIKIHDCSTDEVIVRELNDEEYAQYQADVQSKAERDAEKAKVESDKAAILAKIGLTADEAKLLLG